MRQNELASGARVAVSISSAAQHDGEMGLRGMRSERKWAAWNPGRWAARDEAAQVAQGESFFFFLFIFFHDLYLKFKSNSRLNSKLFTFRCTHKTPSWIQNYIYIFIFVLFWFFYT
jgi:hypothetical protein